MRSRCSWQVISITYFQCLFVALLIQHAMCMHHIVTCGLSGSKIFFFTLSPNSHNSPPPQNVFEHKICGLIFSTSSVWNISHSKKKWERNDQRFILSSCEVTVILVLNILDRLSKKFKYQISWKPLQWEQSCSMWTDGRTDRRDEV